MASLMWTMLCPPGSLWMSKQRVLPCSAPSAVCVFVCIYAIIGQQGGLYNFSLLNVFPLPTFHILYRTGNLWHMTSQTGNVPCLLLLL